MAASLKPVKKSQVRDRVSNEEWQGLVDPAAAYQLAAIYKWTDLIYTHFSARVPGSEDFLINAYGLMFDEISASNLAKIDHHGKVLDDPCASSQPARDQTPAGGPLPRLRGNRARPGRAQPHGARSGQELQGHDP